jgi:hypothetical protein
MPINHPFEEFPKIARLSRGVIVTEKIDGDISQICITDDGQIFAGSRTRWLEPNVDGRKTDNHGFATWVQDNKTQLLRLGPGHHYGEWWGYGIRRGYSLKEKRFSLFNTTRWGDPDVRPTCCAVVPILYEGIFDTRVIEMILGSLKDHGSSAAPGFMRPEGIIIFHTSSKQLFKKTIENDDQPKSKVA